MKYIFVFFFTVLGFSVFGQQRETSLQPVEVRESASTQLSKEQREALNLAVVKYMKKMDDKVEDFNQLMEQNVRKYRKMSKKMKKPQYSDPMYFGHKRKPKKRPVGKRKFCKECHIVH